MRACIQKCKIETDIHKETIRMTTINKISCVHLHSQHLSPKEKKRRKNQMEYTDTVEKENSFGQRINANSIYA